MIDLGKVGFNIKEVDGGETEIYGGVILWGRVRLSRLATDSDGARAAGMNRVKQIIWGQAYGHLDDPLNALKQFLVDPEMSYPELKQFDNRVFMVHLRELVGKLEDAITGS